MDTGSEKVLQLLKTENQSLKKIYIYNWLLTERLRVDLIVRHFVFVCMFQDYGHMIIMIVLEFGIRVFGTESVRMDKNFLFSPFKNAGRVVVLF